MTDEAISLPLSLTLSPNPPPKGGGDCFLEGIIFFEGDCWRLAQAFSPQEAED